MKESELLGVENVMPHIMRAKLFVKEQGFKKDTTIINKDNRSEIWLEANGKTLYVQRTWNINSGYFL